MKRSNEENLADALECGRLEVIDVHGRMVCRLAIPRTEVRNRLVWIPEMRGEVVLDDGYMTEMQEVHIYTRFNERHGTMPIDRLDCETRTVGVGDELRIKPLMVKA